ncbi:MAG: NrfD/PsrC family molybdoenzyme membrane anchor subunit, partial [Bryobacteraceae bacterium]
LLNESVWSWAIPAYYFVGGLAGAALVLAAAAQLRKSKASERLIRRCHWIAFIGSGVSAILLIYDLGRPSRFLNMLRVFRPTSPMNMGAWILSGAGATTSAALLLRTRPGLLGALGEASGYIAGIFGLGLATYTGVLVANTAVPVWQESRRMLPVLFGASAMSSLGSAFQMCVEDPEERGIAKAFGAVGQAAELVASIVMEKQASAVRRVGRPFRRGLSGFLWRSAQLLTAASLLASVLPKPAGIARNRRIAAGALGAAGSLLMRLAVERAGTASARDARASFHLQRDSKSRNLLLLWYGNRFAVVLDGLVREIRRVYACPMPFAHKDHAKGAAFEHSRKLPPSGRRW